MRWKDAKPQFDRLAELHFGARDDQLVKETLERRALELGRDCGVTINNPYLFLEAFWPVVN